MRTRVPLMLVCFSLLMSPEVTGQAQPGDRVVRLLEELSNAPAPSGFEGPVREIVERELRAAGLQVSTDGLGSVIAALAGPSGGPRIMLAAHLDEVGGMVRYITPEGMVKFRLLGGWLDQALEDQRWTILTGKGPVLAVSGIPSPHIYSSDRVTPRNDVFLDVGARTKEEAEALGIRPGDGIAPASSFTVVPGGRYVGKAMDDRVGLVLMIETLRRLKEQGVKMPNTVYFAGTVQEEVGLRGAHTAVQDVKPDLGISLEVGLASDHPGGQLDRAQERLGAGPTIYLADAQMLVNLKLRDFILRVAAEHHIPMQTEVTEGGSEDCAELQRFDAGKPAVNLAVATRYLHSHNSMLARRDLDQAVDLLVTLLPLLDAKTVAEISRF